jgi:hypothetical protein
VALHAGAVLADVDLLDEVPLEVLTAFPNVFGAAHGDPSP